jgi:hypothetical protein
LAELREIVELGRELGVRRLAVTPRGIVVDFDSSGGTKPSEIKINMPAEDARWDHVGGRPKLRER